jgi:hypothetical protein
MEISKFPQTSMVTMSIKDMVRSFWPPGTTKKQRVSRYTVWSTRYDTTTPITTTQTPFPTYYCLTRPTKVPSLSTTSSTNKIESKNSSAEINNTTKQ